MSAPELTVDTTSPVPPYEQIRAQLTQLITAGVLDTGQRLPPVRQLAADLGLAPGTVARAYTELEQAGLVAARRGGGTRVLPAPAGPAAPQLLAQRARDYVTTGRWLGGSDQQILDAVRLALEPS
ncbi:MAG TPA: GntR family transcriptional regulator [Streptosporangiaceae bacterium]|nr:GntR family transcriptional regulator [Streptosporangiaceae bacterium]